MTVLDASAILAFLHVEPGEEKVEAALATGAVCGAANWSEVAQKVIARGASMEATRRLLSGYGLSIEPVTSTDAEVAARMWVDKPSLSLADRLCLALAERLGVPVLTADTAWGTAGGIHQIR